MADAGLARPGSFRTLFEHLKARQLSPDRAEAERAFAAAEQAARETWQFQAMFDLVRFTFPKGRLPFVFARLDAALAALPEETAQKLALRLRLRIALRDFGGFVRLYHESARLLESESHWRPRFARLDAILRGKNFPDFQARKIFGIGLSKTGTTSLNAALSRLGFLSTHYSNEFSTQMFEPEDAFIFDAAVDTPVCVAFELLYHRFENAKFIWTRLATDRWPDAFRRHCLRIYGTTDFAVIRRFPQRFRHQPHITDFATVDCALYFKHADIEEAHEAYRTRVAHFFSDKPGEKLLVLEPGDGQEWQKLCGFLSRPVPEAPYPWKNRSS